MESAPLQSLEEIRQRLAPTDVAEPVGDASRADPDVRGERILRALEAPFLWLDRTTARALPEAWSPFAQTGAIANTMFIVALVSGALLLFWYRVSVHGAWASLEAMKASPLTAELTRSIHRYSSDASMFFVLLHALRLFFARRFTGARWLAWVTGLFLVGMLWLVGWLGYWLVWDERARQVALATARFLDVLPIFTDPLGRSFLTDQGVNSLLFFLVFFAHMLVPLAMGVALWLHITRLSRSWFLTRWPMTLASLSVLVAISLLHPATSAAPPRMTATPRSFPIARWYLAPIAVTDRLGGTLLWGLAVGLGIVLFSLPWALARGRARPAFVTEARCTACTNCYNDCPYQAIQMVPRTDGRPFPARALVDPSKCVGCGICAGSCDSAGIGLDWLPVPDERRRVDAWLDQQHDTGDRLAFVCAESAGASLSIARDGKCADLPGYRVLRVPCIGWVHALSIERALRHGAPGVLLVGCGEGDCRYREGTKWTSARLAAERPPELRLEAVDAARVKLLRHHRIARAALLRDAAKFRDGPSHAVHEGGSLGESSSAPKPHARPRRAALAAAALGLGAVLGLATIAGAEVPYAGPPARGPELVVSFKHPGRTGEHCRTLSDAEKAALPPHMRLDRVCERGRSPVRLRVSIDGREVLERSYKPGGVRSDGVSLAVERLPVSTGQHRVAIAIGESHEPEEWTFHEERTLDFTRAEARVVLFDKVDSFTWR